MRVSVLVFWICGLLSGCSPEGKAPTVANGDVPAGPAAPADLHAITKELPVQWQKNDIVDAMPPRSDDGPTHILAWKIVEDARPLRAEYCLGLKKLKKVTDKQEKWVIASLVRNPAQGKEWNFRTIFITPDPDLNHPPLIMHVQEYDSRPTALDVKQFMEKFNWAFEVDRDWKVIDGGFCEAWERVLGEKPSRTFQR